ncbi:MAG: hypothetical protein OEW83_22335, partial [Acidimicrobiia bacterium]|nr:hypothetical protein [Acidimicrobiia bacterium]
VVGIDLETGAAVPDPSLPFAADVWNGVGFEPGYGTFTIDSAGGTQWLDDGLLEAAGVDAMLLSRCELPEQCEWYWIDRHSGERIDRRVPDTDHRHWVGEVFGPNDRFLILHDQGPGQTYFDTVTGAYLSGAYRPQGDRPAGVAAEAISPDDRYLLVPDGDGVIVYDLQAGTSALLPVEIPGSPLRVELMPKPADDR